MRDQIDTDTGTQPAPAAWWLVETRGPCGVLKEVGRFADRESAADLAAALRGRGLVAYVAWQRG